MSVKTFLDPEEYAYPSGALRNSARRFAAVCPDGKIRRGICSIPDTYFSIPARIKARGKTITGFVTNHDGTYVFIPYTYGKNGGAFDAR